MAFIELCSCARNHNLRLTDVAQDAIDGTLGLGGRASRPARPAPDGSGT